MRRAAGEKQALDLSRAQALRDAIIEFDPAVHELPRGQGYQGTVRKEAAGEGHGPRAADGEQPRASRADRDNHRPADRSDLRATLPADDEGNIYAASFRSSSREVASLVVVSEAVEPGDVLVIDRASAGMMRKGSEGHDSGVVGIVAAQAGVVLGSRRPASDDESMAAEASFYAEVSTAGFVNCKVDADYGAIWPGDLLVTSPTPGHAMRADTPLPGTIIGKALEPLQEGRSLISVLVMLR
jgi:hypothetical protein